MNRSALAFALLIVVLAIVLGVAVHVGFLGLILIALLVIIIL